MNNLKIIFSTALVSIDDIPKSHIDQKSDLSLEKRYDEYRECLEIVKSFGYEFIIMETVKSQDDFLENYGDVFYTNLNNKNFINRGSNYILAMKKILSSMKFEDDDMVIHLTGRYPLVDNSFIERCKISRKVGLFKKDGIGQFYLFLFALRFKELKELIDNVDVDEFDKRRTNLESLFSLHLLNTDLEFVDRLGVIGRQSNSPNSIYGKTIY